MLIETFLTHCAKLLTQRYLAFEKKAHCPAPKPDKNKRYLIYIHIPFCEQLCPYCCFLRVRMEPFVACAYFEALKKEIEMYYNLGFCFDSVYIGGGTPTILPGKLAEIISLVKNIWPVTEISVETNPNHLTDEILRILKESSVNRLSVGVQSFNNEILESIDRLEKYGRGEEIKERLSSVVGMFDTLNVDMIFNFPNQTAPMLAADIEALKEVKADQITYYPLMVSDAGKDEVAKRCGRINYQQEKNLYGLLVEHLTDTYSQDSVWCFTTNKGMIDEYILNYDDYAGLGAGSWGYINGTMYSNTFSIEQYIDLIEKNRLPVIAYRDFSYIEQIRYDFLLKLLEGSLNVADMKSKYGRRFRLYLWKELLFFLATGAITFRDNNIVLTAKGRYYWLVLLRSLFSTVGDYRNIRASADGASSE